MASAARSPPSARSSARPAAASSSRTGCRWARARSGSSTDCSGSAWPTGSVSPAAASRRRCLRADYSLPTLDRAMSAVEAHRDVVSMIATDALNPLRALSFLRYKILYVHLTNVYDNLPVDELVRRDGQLYLVETRAYLPG